MIEWIAVKDKAPPFKNPILVHIGYEGEGRTVCFDVVAVLRESPNDEIDHAEIEDYEEGTNAFPEFQFYLLPAGEFWRGFDGYDVDDSPCLDLYSDSISHWAPLPNQPPGFTRMEK